MKNEKIAELVAIGMITMLGSLPALSQAQHVRGGGQATEQNGQLVLMDTIDGLSQTGRCTWMPMSQVLAQYPVALEALKKLESVHAYAAQAFRSEAERMTVCFGGQLRPLPQSQKGSIFVRVNQNLKTVAYRWNEKVLIDTDKLAQLSSVDQGMLLIHEIGHSFIPMNPYAVGGNIAASDTPSPTVFEASDDQVFSRRDRLWSFINSIYRNYRDGITSAEFGLAITQNGATLPSSDAFWKKSPAAYSTALNRAAAKKDRIVAISQIDMREAKSNLVTADSIEIEFFLNTWYSSSMQIMKDRNYGWEQALRNQIETYGLDPLQLLPNGSSLLTQAIDAQDQPAVNLLLTYPAQSKDRAIRTRFFNAILNGKIVLEDQNVLLNQFDPNEGELITKNENGIQIYLGETPFFVLTIEKGNMDLAGAFLASGKVNNAVLTQGFEALMKLDMGYTNYESTPEQDTRRDLMTAMLSTSGFKPQHEALLAALNSKNEYAAMILLDTVAPTSTELSQLAQNPWSLGYGKDVLKKALTKAGANINAKDKAGKTMIDYAIAAKSDDLFDLLVAAGANKFKKSRTEQEKDWIMGRLIEKNAGTTLTAYMVQTNYSNELDLIKQIDLAQIRLKPAAEKAIQDRLNSVKK